MALGSRMKGKNVDIVIGFWLPETYELLLTEGVIEVDTYGT